MATLYIVATPIGNLEDITFRAIRILQEVDVIFCEDTRVTKTLAKRYTINTALFSLNARTESRKTYAVIEMLRQGKNVALVSDAGTPTISDPGTHLIATVRNELPEVSIVTIPGPSALTAALSISGVSASEFLFLGFLPHKKGRQTRIKEIAATMRTVVCYESPHRIEKLLHALAEYVPNRTITIARELTKIHEEVHSGKAEELIAWLSNNPKKQRGEWVVIVSEGR